MLKVAQDRQNIKTQQQSQAAREQGNIAAQGQDREKIKSQGNKIGLAQGAQDRANID